MSLMERHLIKDIENLVGKDSSPMHILRGLDALETSMNEWELELILQFIRLKQNPESYQVQRIYQLLMKRQEEISMTRLEYMERLQKELEELREDNG